MLACVLHATAAVLLINSVLPAFTASSKARAVQSSMQGTTPAKQASSSSPDGLGAWWYDVLAYLEGHSLVLLFRCSRKLAEAVLTHPGLLDKTLVLGPQYAAQWATAISLANSWGKGVRLEMDDMSAEQVTTTLVEAAAKCVQQQPTVRPLKAVTSVRLYRVKGLPSFIPDFIMEHLPGLTHLKLWNCAIHTLPAVGASLKSWPKLQALTVERVQLGASVTTVQVTQQLQHLPGLQSLSAPGQDVRKWSGVPGVLSTQLTALEVLAFNSTLMPEGCVYPQLKHLYVRRASPIQWDKLHHVAPALTHIQYVQLTTDDLAGLPISWASQLQYVGCFNLTVGGAQPDAAVIDVLSALGKLHLVSCYDDSPELRCLSSCSSELWAAVMAQLHFDVYLMVHSGRPLSRSDVSVMGQHLTCAYVDFQGDGVFEPGVLGDLVQLLPHLESVYFCPHSCTVAGLAALICKADRRFHLVVRVDELGEEQLRAALTECGHSFVDLECWDE